MKRILLLVVVLLSFHTSVQNIAAQWTNVAPHLLGVNIIPSVPEFGVIYFHNGLLWAGRSNLFLSKDSGATWITKIPSMLDIVTSISFYNDSVGIITEYINGTFLTTDQGTSWRNLSRPSYMMSSLFIDGTPNFVEAQNFLSGNVFLTTDFGTSWTTVVSQAPSGGPLIAKGSTLFFLTGSMYGGSALYSSRNDVNLWNKNAISVNIDSYSLTIDSCDANRLVVISENYYDSTTNAPSRIFVSTDGGNTFNETFSKPRPFLSGSIVNGKNFYYCSTIYDGIYRSLDRGSTWSGIGGPSISADNTLLCAIDDSIVIASDREGNIWRTKNSGGYPLIFENSFSLITADQHIDTVGQSELTVPLSISNLNKGHDVGVILHYDTTLHYLGSRTFDGLDADVLGENWNGRAKLHIVTATSDRIICNSFFNYTSFEQKESRVWFDSLTVDDLIVMCAGNIQSNSAESRILPPSVCGSETISNFMEHGKIPEFKLYPNPSSFSLSILSNIDIDDLNVEIIDQLGTCVLVTSKNFKARKPVAIDLKKLTSGSYFLRISSENNIQSIPFKIEH